MPVYQSHDAFRACTPSQWADAGRGQYRIAGMASTTARIGHAVPNR